MDQLKVLIKECGYKDATQQILLKTNSYLMSLREIQEHLLNEIEDKHDLNHCLQEARKIESRVA